VRIAAGLRSSQARPHRTCLIRVTARAVGE
jgi:hypothetical protein